MFIDAWLGRHAIKFGERGESGRVAGTGDVARATKQLSVDSVRRSARYVRHDEVGGACLFEWVRSSKKYRFGEYLFQADKGVMTIHMHLQVEVSQKRQK